MSNNDFKKISKEILEMARIDQKLRSEEPLDWKKITAVDKKNRNRLKEIIKEMDDPKPAYNTVSTIESLAKARGSFTMKIGAINLTGNGVVVLECYPENDAIFELRDDLRKALPFVSQRRHEQEVIHITLGRFLKQVSEEEFREIVDVISDFRNVKVGSFEVNELL